MANSNFVVHNGLTVGPLTINAATGDISTSGNVTLTGSGIVTGPAAAGTLTGATLASGVTASSLTSVGTLTSLGVGAITTTGTLALNAAGGLTTNQTTFLLANATATTVNIGGAATTLNIGATTGTLNLNNATTAIAGNLTITGNLTINGTTTTVNSTTLDVDDLNITVAKGAVNAAAANGAGLTVDGASATILYANSTDTWNFNKNIVGTLSTAAQTNVTSVGTLTGGALGSGFTTVATTVGGTGLTSFTSGGAVYASSTSALTTGTLPVASGGTGITSFGTGVATFLGTPSSANLLAAVTDETGTGALVFATSPTLTTPVLGTPQSGNLSNCTTLPISTGVSGLGTNVAAFLGSPSSANLLSAITDETGSGVLVFGTSPTFTTQITTPAIVHSGTNGVGDIGGSGATFATVYATTFSGVSTTAKYADLAENYSADTAYAPGTVLHFGGEFEVTQCDIDMCARVAGVVSTAPAHLMNTGLVGEHVVALALTGRVPCLVQGTVRKGDMMVSAGNGRARAEANPRVGSVIGKALENFDGLEGVIEVVVGIR